MGNFLRSGATYRGPYCLLLLVDNTMDCNTVDSGSGALCYLFSLQFLWTEFVGAAKD